MSWRLISTTRMIAFSRPRSGGRRWRRSFWNVALRGAVILHVALLTFKYIFREELGARLPGILALLRDLENGSSGLDFIRSLLRYLAQAAGTDQLSATTLRQAVTYRAHPSRYWIGHNEC